MAVDPYNFVEPTRNRVVRRHNVNDKNVLNEEDIKTDKYNVEIKKLMSINDTISPLLSKSLEELKSWFHGCIDRYRAQPLLLNNGDFLIRLAKSIDDHLYKPVLSVKYNDKYYHFLIKERYKLFWIEKLQFSSILALCKYYLNTGDIITVNSNVKIFKPIDCQLWNPAIHREQKQERQRLSGSFEITSDSPNIILEAKSLTAIAFGEEIPNLLPYFIGALICCLIFIVFYVITLFF